MLIFEWLSTDLVLSGIFALAAIALGVMVLKLYRALTSVFELLVPEGTVDIADVAVIVPAYNEAANVADCLASILDSTDQSIQVYLVDDCSTDTTFAIAQTFAAERGDERLQVWQAPPRPDGEVWVGKNWACAYASGQLQAKRMLFIDCDTRLVTGAIEAAVLEADKADVGLLSVGPVIVCEGWAEWLVQPIMMSIMAAGVDLRAVNNPAKADAFAAGPFMLFTRSAYQAIGGHAGVASRVVEDVELARRIKQAGLGLLYGFSGGLVKTRMYPTTRSLWEGWTKNWYEALGRDWWMASYSGAALVLLYVVPWIALFGGALAPHNDWVGYGAIGIAMHLGARLLLRRWADLPLCYWWLSGVGGLMTVSILAASVYRTLTGNGWTWRGRSLGAVNQTVRGDSM